MQNSSMYKDIPAEILAVIEPVAGAHALEVVDASFARGRGRGRLEVVVDTPSGDGRVTIDECARFSREIGHALDAAGAIEGPYLLEVCSPGVDRCLAREKDFERVVGRKVEVETREPLSGRRHFRGELVSFDGRRAEVATEAGPFAIPFELIRRAKAFHPFATPAAKR
jgi:ribosome maturation factor RimP